MYLSRDETEVATDLFFCFVT